MKDIFDAIVVGGGFAGVAATRELARTGHRCLLLEGRSRLGGLTYVEKRNGVRIEHGGTWVGWRQPHVWSELTRYGLTLTQDPRPEIMAMPAGRGVKWQEPSAAFARMDALFARFVNGAAGSIPNPRQPLAHAVRLTELDQYSLRDWLTAKSFTQDERD